MDSKQNHMGVFIRIYIYFCYGEIAHKRRQSGHISVSFEEQYGIACFAGI